MGTLIRYKNICIFSSIVCVFNVCMYLCAGICGVLHDNILPRVEYKKIESIHITVSKAFSRNNEFSFTSLNHHRFSFYSSLRRINNERKKVQKMDVKNWPNVLFHFFFFCFSHFFFLLYFHISNNISLTHI